MSFGPGFERPNLRGGAFRGLASTLIRGVPFAVAITASALAEPGAIDPTVPRRIVVGAPAGGAPMHRIDARRSGRSAFPFPADPVLLRSIRLPSDVAVPPAVDERGRIVAATEDGVLGRYDLEGGTDWSLPLGTSPALGPVLTSNGTSVVLTDDREVVGVTPDGTLAFRTRLQGTHGVARAAPVSGSDGVVTFAVGSRILRIGREGAVEASADVGETVVALAQDRGALLAATEAGRLLVWKAALAPEEVGSFDGPLFGDLVGGGPSEWLAVVGDSKLVGVDLGTRNKRTLANLAPDGFLAVPVILASGEPRFVTRGAWLVGLRHDGPEQARGGEREKETVRLGLSGAAAPGFSGPGAASVPIPMLADDRGAVAYSGARSSVTVALPSNELRSVGVDGCGSTVALLPLKPKVLAVACRSGLIAIIGERAAPAQQR